MSTKKIVAKAIIRLAITASTKNQQCLLKASVVYDNSLSCPFKVTATSVEYALRTAIHSGFAPCDTGFEVSAFSNTFQNTKNITTNPPFALAVAEWFKFQ